MTPYRFSGSHHLTSHATLALTARPEIAFRIGLIASEWAVLEEAFIYFFSIITAKVTVVDGARRFESNLLARSIFTSLDSYSARQGIVRSEFRKRFPHEWHKRYQAVEDEIKRCRGDRNMAVHSLWGITDEFPDDVIRTNDDHNLARFTPADFDKTLERIIDTARALATFTGECQDRLASTART